MMNIEMRAAKTRVAEQKKDPSFLASEDIGYERGAKMVKNYYDKHPGEVLSHFIDKKMIEAILAQPNAAGVTILYGLDEAGHPKPILVGVDVKGNYILHVPVVDVNGKLRRQSGIVTMGGVKSTGTQPCGWEWDTAN